MIMLDTCALLWWSLQPEMLSEAASSACASIPDTGACVSSISLWEIGVKWKKQKIDLGGLDIRSYVSRLQDIEGLEIIPVSDLLWVENIMLDWDHRDPADRTIVATASLQNLPIVTKDKNIRGYYDRVIW